MRPLGSLSIPERELRYAVRRLAREPVVDSGIVTAFNDGKVTLRSNRRMDGFHESIHRDGYVGVEPGDLVIHGLDLVHGSVGVSDSSGQMSPVCWVCRPRDGMEARFIAYALRTIAKAGYVRANAKGVRSAGADYRRWETLAEIPIPSPALEYQVAVADFLDRECERIADLATALLRLATLADASDRVWIERELLAHAASVGRVKLGWFAEVLPGYAFPSAGFVPHAPEGSVRLLRGVNVGVGAIRWDDVVGWDSEGASSLLSWALREGDVVLGMDRPWIKGGLRIATVGAADVPALLLQRVARLRPRDGRLLAEYMRLWLQLDLFKDELSHSMSGVSVPHISGMQIEAYRIAVPSPEVQAACVGEFQERAKCSAALTTRTTAMQTRLAEYRDALITEVVTGQLDLTELSESQLDESAHAAAEGERPEVLTS